ncbi:ferredoxin reductase [Mycobacterium tuberculosis]|nr:ferredoxin reductase [Mycobacterium tuberculosis]
MEYVGHAPGYCRVVFRGDVDNREFTALYLDHENRVLAGMNVNVWDGLADIKELIRSRNTVDIDKFTDPDVPLGTCHLLGGGD